jgi:hypothetical protein
MDVLSSVIAGVVTIVGIVVFYVIYNQFSANLGSAAGLIVVIPIVIAAVALLAILIGGFGNR